MIPPLENHKLGKKIIRCESDPKTDPLLTPEGNMANAIIHLVAVMDRIESHLSKIANSNSKRDDF